MKPSSFLKVRQSESYLEYEIRSGTETAGRYFLFFTFLFLLTLTFLSVIDLFDRGIKNNNIMREFSTPENLLLIIGPFFLFLAMVIISTKANRYPYLIILDAENQKIIYRSYFNIRLNKIPLTKLKGFYCATYERSSNIMSSGNQRDKIIGNGRIFFSGGSYFNRFAIEGLRKISLKDWVIFLEDINTFITENFGSEYNFQDQIDAFYSSQGSTRVDVRFNNSRRKE